MSKITRNHIARLTLVCAALVVGLALASPAGAIHPRYRAYGGYYGVGYAGPNPVGFGFGGYSYGSWPYYGYWGYAPGPYAGFAGYGVAPGPAYAFTGYGGCAGPACAPAACAPAAPCAPACAVPAPPCDPCLMSPCAYRRYMRRMCRAMARCCVPALPVAACGAYGALLGTDGLGMGDEIEATQVANPIDGDVYQPAEQIVPPAQIAPSPSLDRSF